MEVAGAREERSETILKRNSCFQVTDGVPILTFDSSVEKFLSTMEAISKLCDGTEEESFEASEIEQFKSMIVFVREWKQFFSCEWMPFHYKSKTVNFTYQTESAEAKHAINGIKLPHFSSAAVPKVEKAPSTSSAIDNDDFVLHVGGSVWTLDWCPRLYENYDRDVKCEYLAISAHPTGSEYHKIGEQLSGRGFIQIWCFLHLGAKEELLNHGGVRRGGEGSKKVNEPKRRGRPRKTAPSIPNEINGANNIDVIDSPSGPFYVSGIPISNECCVSSGFSTNEEPKNLYGAGNLGGNKKVFEYSDNSVDGPRKSRGRPRKIPDAKTARPRGRPRKHPISSSNARGIVHGDQLLDSSLLSTSGDIGTLRTSTVSVECYKEDLQKGINSVSDLNERGKTILSGGKPIQDVCSQFHVDDSDIPLVSCLPPGSNGMVRPFSGLRRHKNSVPNEHIIVPSENSLALPISRVTNASKESVITEKAIQVDSQEGFNDGGCAMKSCLMNRKSEVKDGAIIIDDDNDQAVKIKGLLPIREDHDLECSVLPSHVDDCREIVTEAENSVQDHSYIPEGIALPRLVLCLAHNGKVAWDMKWRPSDAVDSKAKHHLGYLAVLLGDGALEVWEVPVHGLVKLLYTGCHTEGTDPRFLKLQPVFRCSRMKFGERQSIPLALEWSPSASRDLILAGCHDGTVALWKFCSQLSSKDTKPLLCFTADTVPIRCLAWAPDDSDAECSNLIVTAGHEGLKFWDLRPYRSLLELCPVQRAVLGLDWLKDPRCLVIAYEDGIMRTLSLTKIANDLPVTGEPSAKTKQPGLHSQSCSFFAIWSVQASRSTGLVAYCSSDGCTRYFQLTTEAVDKDSSRYRKPHFLCGSLTEEGATLSINTPLNSIPLPKQPLVSKVVAIEASPINSSMPLPALCWYDHATNNNSSLKKRKGNPSKQAKTGEEGALQDIESRGDKRRQNIARFPPKIVAMHKVRWNMNKGSGRWLCYGGAAGIVRCQVISPR